ncbi:hypothetical protein Sjap_006579 [Stephania japonica]|uniref:AB hydrolase-1 domain-containing protein n=1 Tax=Stephania japonica TaxID=461633 RepID=A0AAP0K685_9MAGN
MGHAAINKSIEWQARCDLGVAVVGKRDNGAVKHVRPQDFIHEFSLFPSHFSFLSMFVMVSSLLVLSSGFGVRCFGSDERVFCSSLYSSRKQDKCKGNIIKGPYGSGSGSTIDVFAIEEGPRKAETVLLLHGLGSSSYSFRNVVRLLALNGVRAVAIDLPGCGFSDKYIVEEEEEIDGFGGVLGRIWGVYREIQEKGLFWGFDQLVESGRVPYEEIEIRVSATRKNWRHLKLGAEEMGRLIGQVIEGLNLSPVHLVLHDSALGMSANWVAENSKVVSSLTVIDSATKSVSLPLWALEVFGVREVLLGFNSVYGGLLRWCCAKSMEGSEVEANRVLLKGRDGRRAVVGIGRSLNHSFSVEEWAGLEVMKGVPVQVVWSGNWSEEWSKEGERVAGAFPQARFVSHSGSRWPQVDAADEITEIITGFVSSLPKSYRPVEEEELPPEHIQKMFDEAENSDQHRHHNHLHDHDHHGGYGDVHSPNYMDAYGLGHGWET